MAGTPKKRVKQSEKIREYLEIRKKIRMFVESKGNNPAKQFKKLTIMETKEKTNVPRETKQSAKLVIFKMCDKDGKTVEKWHKRFMTKEAKESYKEGSRKMAEQFGCTIEVTEEVL